MTYNRSALTTQVITNLGIIGAGETPSAVDSSTVDGLIDPTIAKHIALGIAMSGDTADLSDIPAEIFLPLAALIAFEAATPFQIGGNRLQLLVEEYQRADRDLRRMYRQGFDPKRLKVPHIGRRWPYGVGAFNYTTGE